MFHWNVDPVIFSVGFFQLRWYSLAFLVGFSLGYKIMANFCRWESKSAEQLDSLLVHLVLGTTIGARLGHTLFYEPQYYLSRPLEILKIWEGGLASHGGVLGVMVAIWLFRRRNPDFSLIWLYDRLSIPTIMTCGFIRLGNLFNSEILGRPTEGGWGVVFDRVDQFPRHPAMVYESLAYLAVAAIAYRIYRRYQNNPPQGLILGVVLAVAFLARFIVEFFKENQAAFEAKMSLNMGQILSIPFIVFGTVLAVRAFRQSSSSK